MFILHFFKSQERLHYNKPMDNPICNKLHLAGLNIVAVKQNKTNVCHQPDNAKNITK